MLFAILSLVFMPKIVYVPLNDGVESKADAQQISSLQTRCVQGCLAHKKQPPPPGPP